MEKQKNQIDYVMIEKRWSSSIQNVTTKRDADCDTDHKRLVATLKIRLKCKKKTDLPIRYNVQDISHDFKVELRNRFKVLLELIAEKCPDIIANETRNIIMETAGKHLRKRTNKKQKWMSEQTLNKIKERKECKKNCGTQNDAYKIFAKEVKQLCRNDKKRLLIAKCTKIEDHMKENKSREMYEETNNLTKSFPPRLGVIKDKYGKTLTESETILGRWKEYCADMYSGDNQINTSLDTWIISEQEESGCKTPLRCEIKRAINYLKDRKSQGCDNIHAEMIKASGDEGVEVYHKLCTKIWKSEQWPSDWKKSSFYNPAKERKLTYVFQLQNHFINQPRQ